MRCFAAVPALAVLMIASARAGDTGNPSRPVDFNRDVRPILSETCFQCHGPDKAKRKAGLRLDTKEGAFAVLDGGAVLVPGKPGESTLIERVSSDDPEGRMPPKGSGRSLSKGQVETLRRWVEQGAEWKGHWSYLPPVRHEAPRVEGPAGFVRNDADRFVLEKLVEKGLQPSPEADRETLLRRLSFDLTGLPPDASEVDAFLKDERPDAYERRVDRLLGSPHYGEKMAQHWLDLVRFADTIGYHNDVHQEVALYRDYVIDAFNGNLPFDRFTTEQLAGDLLPSPTDPQRIASGYNKLLMTTQEGGAQAKEYTAKYAADRVRNASSVWMGATLGCAECHDHKFDPYKAKDFYTFAAFFADIQEAAVGPQEQVKIPTPAQSGRAKALDREVARLQAVLDTPTPALADAQAAWEAAPGSREVAWDVLKPVKAVSAGGATLSILGDGSVRASGKNPERDTLTLTLNTGPKPLTALRLEVMPDGSLPNLGPGRASNGNFVLSEFTASADSNPVVWSNATASHSQTGYPVANATDGDPGTGWAILPENGRPNLAVFEARDDFGPCCEECLDRDITVTLRFEYGESHTLGRFRVSATGAGRPVRAEGPPTEVAKALDTPSTQRSPDQSKTLAAYYRSIAKELEPTRQALALAKQQKAEVEARMPTTVVTRSGPPRVMRVLPRGNWLDDSGPVVTPAVPAFLKASTKTTETRATRLDLARWVVSRDNPLTARVFVNRVWASMFGQGLVATPDDFGSQGAWPTHPELLDRLAVDFMESGWDVKRLVRVLVTSGTYRQSSKATDVLRHVDPYNQWLARQGRYRLDAEVVRDNALAVSGLLVRRIGGASARPYQPAGYWSHLNFPKREYEPDTGDGLYRRGLYTYWCRTFLNPSLLAFDAPSREECTVQRTRSNTPLQALVLLNDPTYVEAARALAGRVEREGGDGPESKIGWIYRTVLSRSPRADEVNVLRTLYERPRADSPTEAWTSVARVVLNLHETVTRN